MQKTLPTRCYILLQNYASLSKTIWGLYLFLFSLVGQAQTCPPSANFNLVTPCYVNGARSESPNDDVIVLFNHATARGTSATKQVVASYSEVGTVWGLAYNPYTKKLYAAAFLKRHCDLSPDGLGAIYEIDLTTPTTAGAGTPTLWMNLNSTTHLGAGATLFPSETAANRGLGAIGQPSRDAWAYTRVGRQGLGDIEITADGTKMYVMDLTNRQVLEINMATKTVTNRYPVNAPANYTHAADRRPFGIKHYNGELYVGVVSSGETDGKKKDVKANVMKLSGSSFVNVYEVDSMAVVDPTDPTNDSKVTSYRGNPNFGTGLGWNYYSDADMAASYPDNNPYAYIQNPVPLVSDIEFDKAGNIVIGILDWSGHRMGSFNYRPFPTTATETSALYNIQSQGDMIRAIKSGASWVKEPGVGDFYNDMKSIPSETGWQDDTFKGGMIISDCNGTELVVANMQDPYTVNEGGVIWMKTSDGLMQTNTTGTRVTGGSTGATIADGSRLRIYLSADARPSTFGKAAGLGDLVGTYSVSCVKPIASVAPKNQIVCVGNTAGAFTATPSSGVEYRWYGPLADTTSSLGTAISGQTSASYTPTGAALTSLGTKYYAVVINTTGDATCADTAFVQLVVRKPNAGQDQTICAGNSVTLMGTTPTTGTWTAQGNNPTGATLSATTGGLATAIFSLSASGVFNFIYTDNGCADTMKVSVNAKPNAGQDKSLACADPVAGTLQTTTTLTGFTPSGGTWAALAGNPATASVTNAGVVTGMTVAGSYKFIYVVAGCRDTVAVTVEPCDGCVKPFAGDDQSICAPKTTITLTGFSPAGGTWVPQSGNPAVATVTNAGVVAGMIASGTYKFIYAVVKGGQTCTDTVQVTVLPKPTIADGSATICAGETIDLTSKITNYATYLNSVWTIGTAGGTQVTTPTSVKPTSTTTYVLVAQNASACKDTANVVVTVNPKPNAGANQTLTCTNGSVPSSVQLTATPAGGSWTALASNPTGATVSSAGLVSITNATAQGKSFDFVYSLNGCQDTVKVIVPTCQQPCIKSTITNTAPLCSNDLQTYSFTFTVANKLGVIKVSKGTLSGTNPYTVSGVPTGQNVLITDSLSAICKTDTTITGVNCNCNPSLPKLAITSFTACIGDTFPTLKATVVGLATVEWFSQPTGGTVLFTGLNYKPSGTVSVNKVFYAQARSTDPACPAAISTSRVGATINAQTCIDTIDLALKKLINKKIARIGDVVTYTVKVWNERNKKATGVEVTDSIATTVQFVSGSFVTSRGSATISGNVIKWTIGDIAANGDTVTLTYQIKVTQEGVHFNTAEICKTNEKDIDSTPCNNDDTEDDIDRQCFTVPVQLCPNQVVEVSVPAKYSNVKWFKNGGTIPVATGNAVLFSEVGTYTFTATNQTCPAEGCCPVVIEAGANCCPVNLCIPLTIKQIKKAKK